MGTDKDTKNKLTLEGVLKSLGLDSYLIEKQNILKDSKALIRELKAELPDITSEEIEIIKEVVRINA